MNDKMFILCIETHYREPLNNATLWSLKKCLLNLIENILGYKNAFILCKLTSC